MKKTVIKFGLIAGLIVSIWMLGSIGYCYSTGKFEGNMLLGFASMIIAFSVMYPAVKGYRDKQGGVISFGKAFKMALTIAFIGSLADRLLCIHPRFYGAILGTCN
jgi:hypothetical protein